MRFSLGVLLVCCLAGLQLVAVLAVVFSSYLTSERALLNHARDLLRDVGTNAIEHSKGFLNPARGAAELAARLAQNRVVASDDYYRLEQLLFQQLQLTPQFAGLYFGGENGTFVYVMRSEGGPAPYRSKIIHVRGEDEHWTELIWRSDDFGVVLREFDPDDEFDPRNRPWYTLARADLTTIWTDPYIFFSSQQPGITLAAPVLAEAGGIKGVVGVDIEISRISDFLSRLKIGETGKALIIHSNGDVVAHPQLELIRTRSNDGTLRFANIEEFEDPIARAAFAGLARSGSIPVTIETPGQFTHAGKTYVSTLLPVISDILPWTIAVYAPEDDFTGAIKANRLQNIWIAVLVALITGLIGLALADYIHRPVRAFAVRSSLIAQGEINPAAPAPRTYRELERANDTLVQQIAARREAEREYGQTFELSSRAMAQLSPEDGTVIRANAKFGEILGIPAKAAIGHGIETVAHPDDLERYLCEANGHRGETPPNQEMRWLRPDGGMIWVRLNSIIIRGDAGQPVHAVLTVDNITDERARESQIAQLSRDMSHLARGNTMGQLAAGLAHELNQPLTAIAQNAGTVLLTLHEQPHQDPELRVILEEIESQSIRAGEIIRALRGFIRKDEGASTAFDLTELLGQTLRLVHAEAAEAGVTIGAEIAEVPPLFGNRVQIAQVIVNLLRNAIEVLESDAGERQIVVSARIRPSAGEQPAEGQSAEGTVPQVEVVVADNGPGIAPGIALFSKFETSKSEGMGLGLSICRTIVEASGGRIWHEPNRPRGARFCFTVATAPGPRSS